MAVVAPSDSRALVRETRGAVKALATDRDALFGDGAARLLGVGQTPARSARGGAVSLPVDVSRTIEDCSTTRRLDLVHVHEPFAPSAARARRCATRGR